MYVRQQIVRTVCKNRGVFERLRKSKKKIGSKETGKKNKYTKIFLPAIGSSENGRKTEQPNNLQQSRRGNERILD